MNIIGGVWEKSVNVSENAVDPKFSFVFMLHVYQCIWKEVWDSTPICKTINPGRLATMTEGKKVETYVYDYGCVENTVIFTPSPSTSLHMQENQEGLVSK